MGAGRTRSVNSFSHLEMLGGRGGAGCAGYGIARALAWVNTLTGASQRERKVGFCYLNIPTFRQVLETNKVGYNDTWPKSHMGQGMALDMCE